MLDLPRDEAHVWYLFPDGADPALEEQGVAWLDPEEAARHARRRFPEGRREVALSRVLLRATLSRYAPVAPADWRFETGPHGRPAIARALGVTLPFNLTHTRGLIACVVAREPEVGIDAEAVARERPVLGLAARHFSPAEVAVIAREPERFLDFWTLKEAYLKARGLGLDVPLDQLSFTLGAAVTATFDPRLGDAAEAWQFDRLSLSSGHRVATAIRRSSAARVRIVERPFTPPADR